MGYVIPCFYKSDRMRGPYIDRACKCTVKIACVVEYLITCETVKSCAVKHPVLDFDK